jgi:N,N'-diacetyllegionaminate synthase
MLGRSLVIGDSPIGMGHCFVVAEAGVNHDGDLDQALALIDAAASSGADAVKFQTFSADRLATSEAPKARYQERDPAATQYDMLRRLELDGPAHRRLAEHARAREIEFLSSPFDELSADLLETIGVAAFKIPSGELTNIPLLQHIAKKLCPMIVSTGMATLEEVQVAVDAIQSAGAPPIALLHCVSAYPAEPRDANLRAMFTLRETFDVPVGWSDHMLGDEVALAAAALGAAIIEKHLTLDRTLPGPDHAASLEPDEFGQLVRGIRMVEAALGSGEKRPTEAEIEIAAAARRSIVAARALHEGQTLSNADVMLRRPGTGLPPTMLQRILGRRAARPIAAGAPLREEWLV